MFIIIGTPNNEHETLILKTTSGFYYLGGLVIGGKDYKHWYRYVFIKARKVSLCIQNLSVGDAFVQLKTSNSGITSPNWGREPATMKVCKQKQTWQWISGSLWVKACQKPQQNWGFTWLKKQWHSRLWSYSEPNVWLAGKSIEKHSTRINTSNWSVIYKLGDSKLICLITKGCPWSPWWLSLLMLAQLVPTVDCRSNS